MSAPFDSMLVCLAAPQVRAVAAGGKDLVVSGDKNGELAVWKVL